VAHIQGIWDKTLPTTIASNGRRRRLARIGSVATP